ncbi:MAG: hypothetical protein FJZ98_01145 [Chloroflexi bacterium]|nr:hypothetical protein [Chloroflexota bacterium]
MIATLKIKENYWENFSVEEEDLDYIYNLLLEKAIPLPIREISEQLIEFRIEKEWSRLQEKRSQQGNIYLPKDEFKVGDNITFPAFEMQAGKVRGIRDGFNPDFPDLKVIEVEFEGGKNRSFASCVENHALNHILDISEDDPNLDLDSVSANFGENVRMKLIEALEKNDDLVKIAGNWFPRSLLVDVHIGYLNLAEAVLEEAKGGPIGTVDLMKQVELKANVDDKLLEFSLNLALDEDDRFDEVGPSGETLWFLKQLEPESVREKPIYLQYQPQDYPTDEVSGFIEMFERNLFDEMEAWDSADDDQDKVTIALSFPHWRSGTLPLSTTLKRMFPTAYEAPRVKFTFFDPNEKEKFPGWVVRPGKYIFGLKDWYEKHDLMPGSLVTVEKRTVPGEINISFTKSRQNREWLKTVLVGTDHGFVYAMLKHPLSAAYNERMAIAIPDTEALDEIWKQKIYAKEPLDKSILRVMRELAKLNPQGQVHAQELYAAVNVIRRSPPGIILYQMIHNQQISHLGDLYFRISEKE